MLKQTVNKNNIHVPVGVSRVSQLVVMILLIHDCYVTSSYHAWISCFTETDMSLVDKV